MEPTVTFRPATMMDAPLICQWWNDPTVMKWVGFPRGLSATATKVQKSLTYYQQKNAAFLLILDEEETPIGEFCYEPLADGHYQLDIKIGDTTKLRQGYAMRALTLGCQLLQEKFDANQIILNVNAANAPALGLYRKFGFKQVDFLPDDWENQLGEKMSTVVLAKTL